MVDEDDKSAPNIYSLDRDDGDATGSSPKADADEPAQTTRVVALHLEQWTGARESLARLDSELQSSREDVRRAVDYARELEGECDRLADLHRETEGRIAEIRSEFDEERGRRLELEERCEHLVERLEELSGIRGRFHLERGRREQLEEENDGLTERVRNLERDLETLHEALEEARRQGFKVELGPLSIELKR